MLMRTILMVLGTASASIIANPVTAGEVQIVVNGVQPGSGEIVIGLFRDKGNFPWSPTLASFTASAAAQAQSIRVVIKNVPPGQYALAAFHDKDGSRKVPRNIVGYPKTGVGFGNDASIRLGPPSFESATVSIGAEETTKAIRLVY